MNELKDKRMVFATEVFHKFVTSKETRLKYGASKRAEMQAALKKGQKVSGYRAEWILSSMHEVIKTLIKSSESFNNTYFNDLISVEDMKDVLTSAINKLNSTGKKKKD